jgi:hypothetical protein
VRATQAAVAPSGALLLFPILRAFAAVFSLPALRRRLLLVFVSFLIFAAAFPSAPHPAISLFFVFFVPS